MLQLSTSTTFASTALLCPPIILTEPILQISTPAGAKLDISGSTAHAAAMPLGWSSIRAVELGAPPVISSQGESVITTSLKAATALVEPPGTQP
jgi:hypothetical protein